MSNKKPPAIPAAEDNRPSRRAGLAMMTGALTAAIALAAAGTPGPARAAARAIPRNKRAAFARDFSNQFGTQLQAKISGSPDLDLAPGIAPPWVHELLDWIWDKIFGLYAQPTDGGSTSGGRKR